jgi:hypothetical protein
MTSHATATPSGRQEESLRYAIFLGVDHNHTTGEIRDLLCHHCNAAIGHLMESPELMR